MSLCNQVHLETLGYQPIMPKTLLGHCLPPGPVREGGGGGGAGRGGGQAGGGTYPARFTCPGLVLLLLGGKGRQAGGQAMMEGRVGSPGTCGSFGV